MQEYDFSLEELGMPIYSMCELCNRVEHCEWFNPNLLVEECSDFEDDNSYGEEWQNI